MKKAMLFAGAAALGAAAMGRGRRAVEAGQKFVIVDTLVPGGRWVDQIIYDSSAEADRAAAHYATQGDVRRGHVQVIDAVWYAPAEARLRTTGMRGQKGRRAATRRRTYKTLAGLKRAMGDRGELSLETIFSERANIKGVGWTPIRYTLTDEDISEIATKLGGHERTQNAVANGLRYGRISKLPYSTRQRITWDKYGWGYIAGQDHRAETARIRNILKK